VPCRGRDRGGGGFYYGISALIDNSRPIFLKRALLRLLPLFLIQPINVNMDTRVSERPSWDQVSDYFDRQIEFYLGKHGADLPFEQKDEVRQRGRLRVIEAFPKIVEAYDAWESAASIDKPAWKSFVQTHCRGAVLDYIRDGAGFEESYLEDDEAEDEAENAAPILENELTAEDAEPEVAAVTDVGVKRRPRPRLKYRMSPIDQEQDHPLDVEEVVALYGEPPDEIASIIKPRWDLVARLARHRPDIHLVAKILMGFTQAHESENFNVSRERLSQRISEFFARLDSPEYYHDPMTKQLIYALGMCEYYGMKDEDQGLGWEWEPVDLFAHNSVMEIFLVHQSESPELLGVRMDRPKKEKSPKNISMWAVPTGPSVVIQEEVKISKESLEQLGFPSF